MDRDTHCVYNLFLPFSSFYSFSLCLQSYTVQDGLKSLIFLTNSNTQLIVLCQDTRHLVLCHTGDCAQDLMHIGQHSAKSTTSLCLILSFIFNLALVFLRQNLTLTYRISNQVAEYWPQILWKFSHHSIPSFRSLFCCLPQGHIVFFFKRTRLMGSISVSCEEMRKSHNKNNFQCIILLKFSKPYFCRILILIRNSKNEIKLDNVFLLFFSLNLLLLKISAYPIPYIEWQKQYVPRAEIIVIIKIPAQIIATVLYVMVHILEVSHSIYFYPIIWESCYSCVICQITKI